MDQAYRKELQRTAGLYFVPHSETIEQMRERVERISAEAQHLERIASGAFEPLRQAILLGKSGAALFQLQHGYATAYTAMVHMTHFAVNIERQLDDRIADAAPGKGSDL